MLLDNCNPKLKLIKYQGTNSFIAILVQDEKDEKYYFSFLPTENPMLTVNNEEEYTYDIKKIPLLTFDKYQVTFEVKGKTFGKDKKLYYLIPIKPEEFDSLYKLLECVLE